MHKRFNLLDVKISAVNPDTALLEIDEMVQSRKGAYICVAPVSTLVHCQENENYRKVINEADMVTPDGMPVVWLARMLGYTEVQRTYGPDLMLSVCDFGQKKGYRHYFYGGTDSSCALLKEKLHERFPRITITGNYSPPFQPEVAEERQEILDQINRERPDILWVGLGSPKQDIWIYQNRAKLNVPVIIGIGAAFDFLSGVKRQAPKWMQRCGLEWLFRLCCEPQRLWKRYLIGNTKFIYYLIKRGILTRSTTAV